MFGVGKHHIISENFSSGEVSGWGTQSEGGFVYKRKVAEPSCHFMQKMGIAYLEFSEGQ